MNHQKENFANIWEVNLLSDKEKELFPPIPAVEESISLSSPTVSSSGSSATASEEMEPQLLDNDFFANYSFDDETFAFLDDEVIMGDLDCFTNDVNFHLRDQQEENKQQHISNIPGGIEYRRLAEVIEESLESNVQQQQFGQEPLSQTLIDNVKTEPSTSTSPIQTQEPRRKRKSEQITREIAPSPPQAYPSPQIAEQEEEEMDLKPSLPKRMKRTSNNKNKNKKVVAVDENKPECIKKHQLDPKKFPEAKNAIQAKRNREKKKQELIDLRIKTEKQQNEIRALRKQALQYQMVIEAHKENENQLQLQLQHEREARHDLENSTSNYKAIADVLRTSLGQDRFPALITELLTPSSGDISEPIELVDDNQMQMHFVQFQ